MMKSKLNWSTDTNGNKIAPTAIIYDNVILGHNNVIMDGAIIGGLPHLRDGVDEYMNKRTYIGDNNVIGENTLIKASAHVGNKNIIMGLVNIGHDVVIGNENEIGAVSVICGHVKMGSKNKIKVGCNIRNRLMIGNRNLIGMGTTLVKSLSDDKEVIG